MRLEPLTKAVEQADFLAFREIVLRYLVLRGFHGVTVTDGPNDGGSDFLIRAQGGNPVPIGIAITVQRTDWAGKVRADCRRAKEALGLDNMMFITSRRLPQVDFTKVADELWQKDGIRVQVVDSQTLASHFFSHDEAPFVLNALGISLDERRPEPAPRPDLKEDAAYAFAFFGDATDKFRRSVIEHTLVSYLTGSDTTAQTRDVVEIAVTQALQLHEDQIALVSSAVDRMLQQQRLHVAKGRLTVDESVSAEVKVVRALRERQWRELAKQIDSYLANELKLAGEQLERASQVTMESAGSLFMQAASSASVSIRRTSNPAPIRAQMRKRIKEITNTLLTSGIAEAMVGPAVTDLAQLVSNSPIGYALMAGELFVSLASMQTNEFERAFGSDGSPDIYLDASVVIPMITALLFTPAQQRFSSTALRVYKLAASRRIPLLLPKVYLEEAASHLMDAVAFYQPILGQDDDLRFSQNAFVAHFSDLTSRGLFNESFKAYARYAGYVERDTSQERQRQMVMNGLSNVLEVYKIQVADLDPPDADANLMAQEAITFTSRDLRLERSGRLLAHDVGVIASLMSNDSSTLFCTWDKLHLSLGTANGRSDWQAFDPPMLGDLLVLARPQEAGELMTTVSLAMELGEEQSQQGADVLDALVRIESDSLFDAEILTLAKQFKTAYVAALRENAAPNDLAEAWGAWKSGDRHLASHAA